MAVPWQRRVKVYLDVYKTRNEFGGKCAAYVRENISFMDAFRMIYTGDTALDARLYAFIVSLPCLLFHGKRNFLVSSITEEITADKCSATTPTLISIKLCGFVKRILDFESR